MYLWIFFWPKPIGVNYCWQMNCCFLCDCELWRHIVNSTANVFLRNATGLNWHWQSNRFPCSLFMYRFFFSFFRLLFSVKMQWKCKSLWMYFWKKKPVDWSDVDNIRWFLLCNIWRISFLLCALSSTVIFFCHIYVLVPTFLQLF